MGFMHHLTTGGEGPVDAFPQTSPAQEVPDHAPELSSGADEIAEKLQDLFVDYGMAYLPPVDSDAFDDRDYSTPGFDLRPGYCKKHGNRVGSAPGRDFICGYCEDGE